MTRGLIFGCFSERSSAAVRTLPCTFIAASLAVTLNLGCGARSGFDLSEPASSVGASSTGGTSGATGSVVKTPTAGGCEAVTVAIDQLRPAVTVLVDQSSSMGTPYPDSTSPITRWSLVGAALFDPTFGVIKKFELSVRFGVAFFTSHNGFSGGVCPILSEVSAATGNYDAMLSLYDRLQPDDDTPTGAAIAGVVGEIARSNPHGQQVLVLVTDGDPDTCAVPDPQNGQADAILAAQNAHASGIDLYVLGISRDIDEQKLQEIANAGQGAPTEAVWGVDASAAQPFHASDNLTGLAAQLSGILSRIPFCEVRLQRDIGTAEAMAAHVSLDGVTLKYGSANGFSLQDPRHLEVTGQACDALKASGKELSVRISCD